MRSTLVALAVLASAPLFAQAPPQLTLDHRAIAERIVRQMAPRPGERILLLAHPGQFEALVPHLRYALAQAGAVDLGVMDVLATPYPTAWDLGVWQRAWNPAKDALRSMLREVDGAVMMPGPVRPTPPTPHCRTCCAKGTAAPSTSTGTAAAARVRSLYPVNPFPPRP